MVAFEGQEVCVVVVVVVWVVCRHFTFFVVGFSWIFLLLLVEGVVCGWLGCVCVVVLWS
jgi:hypothetical protein